MILWGSSRIRKPWIPGHFSLLQVARESG